MPNGTILDLNVACLAMMMCLDSGGGKVTHTEVTYARCEDLNAVNTRTVWSIGDQDVYGYMGANTEDVFSEISRELAASVWGVTL